MTQCEKIEEYINKHGSIDTMEAFNMGITRLASRINDMKNAGFNFKKEWKTAKNRRGQTVSYIVYSWDK